MENIEDNKTNEDTTPQPNILDKILSAMEKQVQEKYKDEPHIDFAGDAFDIVYPIVKENPKTSVVDLLSLVEPAILAKYPNPTPVEWMLAGAALFNCKMF